MKELKLTEFNYQQPLLHLSLNVSRKLMSEIIELAFTEDGCEQGGFLIGRYPNDSTAVIEGIVSPISRECNHSSFVRYTEGMQSFWNALYKEKGLIYLGEWHSHPSMSATYSDVDLRTMIEIAESDTVNIRFPIFLIVGHSKENPDIKFYTICNQTIFTYE